MLEALIYTKVSYPWKIINNLKADYHIKPHPAAL